MSPATTTIWNDILSQVKLNHPDLARGWFSDLQLASVDSGVVHVRTINEAQSQYLRQHCGPAFAEAAQTATGRLVSVRFDADEASSGRDRSPGFSFDNPEEQARLNPDYTFENFVTGPCNRLAHAAALAVAEEPGQAYNPFFVYGPVGLGKTHLLQATCHAALKAKPDSRLLFLSCETFINHFVEAVERGALHQFRYRYRHVDLLVIDDVQFLAERERSQEEFFHTFNTLHQSLRQIILSADCSPSEIASLEERLVSRFNSGLVALVDRPCLETRMAIVRKKAKLRCIEIPEDVVRLIARRIETNIRELEGALIKLDALSQTRSGVINMALAVEAFGTKVVSSVGIPMILEAVAQRLNVKVSDIQGKKRSKACTYPRHVCIYLARQLTGRSLEEIGGYFGGRDHSTILHASRTIARRAKENEQLRSLLQEITADLKNGRQ